MLRTRVIPCLLLRNRGLVKTIKFKNPAYVGDPINTVRIFNEKEVDELIVLDITATTEDKGPPFEMIKELASECFMPLACGGGIGSPEDAKRLFRLGVEKIILNSQAVENPKLIAEIADTYGSQSVIVSIDARKKFLGGYEVRTRGGKQTTGLDPVEYAKRAEQLGAGELMVTSIDRDGTMEGYDINLIGSVCSSVSIPVIACGGAGEVNHLTDAVRQGGASAVATGSMVVYQGKNRAVLINFPTQKELKEALD